MCTAVLSCCYHIPVPSEVFRAVVLYALRSFAVSVAVCCSFSYIYTTYTRAPSVPSESLLLLLVLVLFYVRIHIIRDTTMGALPSLSTSCRSLSGVCVFVYGIDCV